jgi:hypothetical protein
MGKQATPQFFHTVIGKDGKPLMELCRLPADTWPLASFQAIATGYLLRRAKPFLSRGYKKRDKPSIPDHERMKK